jgi:dTDP-D-glucose 4,6-dehydratase
MDATKVEAELGWKANYPFEKGIEKTVSWYLQNREWWEPLTGRVGRRDTPLHAETTRYGQLAVDGGIAQC